MAHKVFGKILNRSKGGSPGGGKGFAAKFASAIRGRTQGVGAQGEGAQGEGAQGAISAGFKKFKTARRGGTSGVFSALGGSGKTSTSLGAGSGKLG